MERQGRSTLRIMTAKFARVGTLHLQMCVFLLGLCAQAVPAALRRSEWEQGADLSAAGGSGSSGH